jgi:hypothetical protein
MASALSALAATDPATKLADWLELTALAAADRNASIQDLIQVIRRSGTADATEAEDEDDEPPPDDRGSEVSQAVADAAFAEIEARAIACGRNYPYKVNEQNIQATRSTDQSIYVFLLLVANYGAKAGSADPGGLALFDDLAAQAAKTYMHGESYVFAFPRRVAPSGFVAAIEDLVKCLGEGQGNRMRPTTKYQNDAKLDIVSWRPFEDGRPGKVIAFGQCATGNNWKSKLPELQPRTFYSEWFTENPIVDPIRMFFMPFRVIEDDWRGVGLQGGVVFDRCRLALHGDELGKTAKDQIAAWNRDVLAKKVRA